LSAATAPAVRERPLIFSAPMVRAILAGRKTQTRRVVKPQPVKTRGGWEWRDGDVVWRWPGGVHTCPYGRPGDRLWVKEVWTLPDPTDPRTVCYRASDDPVTTGVPWRSPLFMPRAASRITLEVTAVRVERVQDISTCDVRAEGIDVSDGLDPTRDAERIKWVGRFARTWDAINGKRAPWASNPWVWAITFRVAEPAAVGA
jgi:hypothetical protein